MKTRKVYSDFNANSNTGGCCAPVQVQQPVQNSCCSDTAVQSAPSTTETSRCC